MSHHNLPLEYCSMDDIFFTLEAKVAPNVWKTITEVYPELGFEKRYATKKQAADIKSELKRNLMGKWQGQYLKYPIRIREVECSRIQEGP